MACKVTMTLRGERQDGPIGDDWRYTVEAKVFNQGLTDKGKIKIGKHSLPSGVTQEAPGDKTAITLNAGECGDEFLVRIQVNATEVDWLIHDRGTGSLDVNMRCPGAGETPAKKDVEISVGVRESPGISGETSVFRSYIRLVAECE